MIALDKKLYILKIKQGTNYADTLRKNKTYKIPEDHIKKFENSNDSFNLIIIIFNPDETKKYIGNSLLFCEGKIEIDNSNKKIIKVNIYDEINNKEIVSLLLKAIQLDLDNDFASNEYIAEDYSYQTLKDLLIITRFAKFNNNPMCNDIIDNSFNITFNNFAISNLSKLSLRIYKDNLDTRNEFQRDRDRIIHSKAFRRLVDKAQIFTSSKGDHYRTRLTHTLEVTQIARSISRKLNLNEDLTEAIALAHDIGHTPFGHVGERTLDAILSGKIKIIKNIDEPKLQQHFKHNFQTLRVLSYLENKYPYTNGLNLSFLTLEGAWKHTKISKICDNERNLICDLNNYFKYPYSEFLFPEFDHSITAEGQVVAIADEIAQRSHDIDDAFKSGKISHETFIKFSNARYVKELLMIDNKIKKDIETNKNNGFIIIDENDMYRAQLCSQIINYFINDIDFIYNKNNIENCFGSKTIFNKNYKYLSKKIIDFSNNGKKANSILDKLVSNYVIGSSEVSRFDTTAKDIIVELFKYYYNNPLTLEETTLKKYYIELEKYHTNTYFKFVVEDISYIRNEFEKIVHNDLEKLSNQEEYLNKRKILCQCIADHISGMTDSYAMSEYRRIKGIVNIMV
ncbi:MAG: dNTP triphosphohydrolase [Erysipelotrichaceae bacterium]|nr:dNTP triphosphohydrolase [Erysipelotrichaceae bacterium]